MPLSEKTIEASIDSDAKNNVKEITKVVEGQKEKNKKLAFLRFIPYNKRNMKDVFHCPGERMWINHKVKEGHRSIS